VVGGAYVTNTAAIAVWLVGTVDRVTEFPALTGWWIVAMWAVVASGALGATRSPEHRHTIDPRSDPRSDADTIGHSSRRLAPTPVGVAAE